MIFLNFSSSTQALSFQALKSTFKASILQAKMKQKDHHYLIMSTKPLAFKYIF
jgi:hypothetical protein